MNMNISKIAFYACIGIGIYDLTIGHYMWAGLMGVFAYLNYQNMNREQQ